MVLMELQFLQEIGLLIAAPSEWLTILRRDFEVTVCPIPFHAIVEASYSETWTRDPFDRIIVAHAKTASGKLITKDTRIREHFQDALW
jgi:PIN domain nuclease of toxin-antitoxin system